MQVLLLMINCSLKYLEMKKTVLLLSALCLMAACERNKPAPEQEAFSFNTLSVNDSVQFPESYLEEWHYTDKSYYKCEIDEPVTKNQALHDSIVEWIASQLVDVTTIESRDIKALMERDKKSFLTIEDSEPGYESQTFLKLREVSDNYVTYVEESYLYLGGAHGMPYYYCATFNSQTGRRFSYEMFKTFDGLNEMLEDGIINQYFGDMGEDGFDIDDVLFVDKDEPFPLPFTMPWIECDSVHFCYGAYEIAPFVVGMPECSFPYSAMEKFLTDEGKTFFAK